MELSPGSTVDKFVVEEMIGQGGMASVYRIRHRDFGVAYALKIMHTTLPELAGRIRAEGSLQAGLQHPNIVTVFDMVDVAGHPALVMEYVEGPSLHAFLHAYRPNLEQIDDIARGILRGVRFAHGKGMIHRDIKPANVLLANADDAYLPKITDFGLAKSMLEGANPSHMQTRTGAVMGTPAYMAPEQFRNSKDVNHRADVYSLGVVLYELVSGQRPYEPDDLFELLEKVKNADYPDIAELVPSVPDRMVDAIEGAMVVDAKDRIPDVDTLYNIWCGRVKVERSRIWDKGTLKTIGERLNPQVEPSNPSDLPQVAVGLAPSLEVSQPAPQPVPTPAAITPAPSVAAASPAAVPAPAADSGPDPGIRVVAETSFQPLIRSSAGGPISLVKLPAASEDPSEDEVSEESDEPEPVGPDGRRLEETRFEPRHVPPADAAAADPAPAEIAASPQAPAERKVIDIGPPVFTYKSPPLPDGLAAAPHVVPAVAPSVEWSTPAPSSAPSLHIPPPATAATPAPRRFGAAGAGAAALGLALFVGVGLTTVVLGIGAIGLWMAPAEQVEALPPLQLDPQKEILVEPVPETPTVVVEPPVPEQPVPEQPVPEQPVPEQPQPAKPDPAPKPKSAKGRVKLSGDAAAIRLTAGGKAYAAGAVPVGSYQLWATFPGRGEVDLGVTVKVVADETVDIFCQAKFDTCRVR